MVSHLICACTDKVGMFSAFRLRVAMAVTSRGGSCGSSGRADDAGRERAGGRDSVRLGQVEQLVCRQDHAAVAAHAAQMQGGCFVIGWHSKCGNLTERGLDTERGHSCTLQTTVRISPGKLQLFTVQVDRLFSQGQVRFQISSS